MEIHLLPSFRLYKSRVHKTNDLDPVTRAQTFLMVADIVTRGEISLWIISHTIRPPYRRCARMPALSQVIRTRRYKDPSSSLHPHVMQCLTEEGRLTYYGAAQDHVC